MLCDVARTVTLLDGALGTELGARGAPLDPPLWSAAALESRPELVASIHREYAAAGAVVHTANTFRTKRRAAPDRWRELARRAVELARGAVPNGARVAGSIAPLEDCYRPDLSPADPRPEHRELARELAAAGVDLLLCETFPHVGEALVAVEEAVATGLPTWVALTAGPSADLLTPSAIAEGAREAIARGAEAVLVSCTPAREMLRFLEALAPLGVPFGAYANAGSAAEGVGWGDPRGPERYAAYARTWIEASATLVGGCCGTSPAHVAAIAAMLDGDHAAAR